VDIDAPPDWSGKQLKRLGQAIVDPESVTGSHPPYHEVMEWHADLADEVSSQIADRSWASLSGSMDVSSRAKTIDTLREKLMRETHLNLNQVQDLAGVRVDFEGNLEEQTAFAEELAAYFGGEPRALVKDIRQEPHSGYRAVHLWLRLPAGRVEVQLRTRYQSAWANLYERLGDLLGRHIRYGDPGSGVEREVVEGMQRQSSLLQDAEEKHLEILKLRASLEETEQEIEELAEAKWGVEKSRLDELREKAALAKAHAAAAEAKERERLTRFLEGMELLQSTLDSVDPSKVGDEDAGIRN